MKTSHFKYLQNEHLCKTPGGCPGPSTKGMPPDLEPGPRVRPAISACPLPGGGVRPKLRGRFAGQNRRETYSRIMCFQYGQSCPPSGPQLSSECRMPFPPRISESRYDGPEFSHWPV